MMNFCILYIFKNLVYMDMERWTPHYLQSLLNYLDSIRGMTELNIDIVLFRCNIIILAAPFAAFI